MVTLDQYETSFEENAPYSVTYSLPCVEVDGDSATVVADRTVSSAAGHEPYYSGMHKD